MSQTLQQEVGMPLRQPAAPLSLNSQFQPVPRPINMGWKMQCPGGSTANCFPTLPNNNDGSYVSFPTVPNNGTLNGYSNAQSLLYTNAVSWSGTGGTGYWIALWMDTVENKLYVLTVNNAQTTFYLGYINNFTTGAWNLVGTSTPGTNTVNTSSAYQMKRAQMGSGDFTIYALNPNAQIAKFNLSSTTGAITVAASNMAQNGISPNLCTPSGFLPNISNDETFLYGIGGSSTVISSYVREVQAVRNGKYSTTLVDFSAIGGVGYQNGSLAQLIPWGVDVVGIGGGPCTDIPQTIQGPKFFQRSAFEAWIAAALNMQGLP